MVVNKVSVDKPEAITLDEIWSLMMPILIGRRILFNKNIPIKHITAISSRPTAAITSGSEQ